MSGIGALLPAMYGEPAFQLVANPAPGANPVFILTVPSGEIWRPLSMHYVYTSDAVAANRDWSIAYEQSAMGGISFWRSGASATTRQTAGQRRRVVASVNNGDIERVGFDPVTGLAEVFHVPLGESFLFPGCLWYLNYTAVGPADQCSDIIVHYLKWRTK